MRGCKAVVAGAAVAMLAAGGVIGGTAGTALADPAGSSAAVGDGLARFRQQPVAWHRCQLDPKDEAGQALDAAKAQCAEVTVPLDYARPDGRTITVTMSRLKATVSAGRRRGVLLVNPGGPGRPALTLPLELRQVGPKATAGYDLIGMDPRGAGRSMPLTCRWPTSGLPMAAGPDRRTFDESVALAKDLAARCADQKDVLPHLSTRNTARDLDVIRAALGERKISYYGASYGTELGAVYLQLFPARADRFVLDSAVDPDRYGPQFAEGSNAAKVAALNAWAAWAARHHSQYRLGATTRQVLATVEQLRTTVDRRPVQVGTYRIDSHLLPLLLVVDGDSEQSFADQAAAVQVVRDAARGATVTPTPALAQFLEFVLGPAQSSAPTAILCADRAVSRDPETYWRDLQAHRAAEPLYGPLNRNLLPCAFWPSSPAESPTRIHNDVPALILNATGDVRTTYADAQAMHRALTGSRLVTLKGAYQHVIYPDGRSACVARTVERYLVDGVLPSRDITCTRDR